MKVFLHLFSLFISTCVYTQSQFEIGLNGTYADSHPKAQEQDHKAFGIKTISFGGTIDYTPKKWPLSFGSAIIYDRRGYRDTWSTKYMDYITLPLKLTGSFGQKFFIRGSTGYNCSFLVNSEGYSEVSQTQFNYKVRSFDISVFLELGLGYYFNQKLGIYSHIKLLRSLTDFDSNHYGWLKHRKHGLSLRIIYRV